MLGTKMNLDKEEVKAIFREMFHLMRIKKVDKNEGKHMAPLDEWIQFWYGEELLNEVQIHYETWDD